MIFLAKVLIVAVILFIGLAMYVFFYGVLQGFGASQMVCTLLPFFSTAFFLVLGYQAARRMS